MTHCGIAVNEKKVTYKVKCFRRTVPIFFMVSLNALLLLNAKEDDKLAGFFYAALDCLLIRKSSFF